MINSGSMIYEIKVFAALVLLGRENNGTEQCELFYLQSLNVHFGWMA
jgi:hypothetical protein